MSQVFPLIDGFVGYSEGREAQLRTDEPWDTDHPLYAERPELFTEPAADEPPAERPPSGPADEPPTTPVEPQPKPTRAPRKPKAGTDA
jgi:hypothetical protein